MLTTGLVLAPRLVDANQQLGLFIDLSRHVQYARGECPQAGFGQSQCAAAVQSRGDLPQPNATNVARDRGLHKVAHEALQIEDVVFPASQPRGKATGTEVEQRTTTDHQLLLLAPFQLPITRLPVVLTLDDFDLVPRDGDGCGVERGGEQFVRVGTRYRTLQFATDRCGQTLKTLQSPLQRLIGVTFRQDFSSSTGMMQRFVGELCRFLWPILARGCSRKRAMGEP